MGIKLETIESDSNYVATCITLPPLKKVDGLDSLSLVTVFGYNCLVGNTSAALDKKYLFFPAESVLAQDFLSTNNLYRKSNLNKDTTIKGFFDESGRVKAIKFKGVVSSGFLIPISSLTYLGYGGEYSSLRLGDTFHSIDGNKICWKYRRPVAPQRLTKGQKLAKNIEKFDIVIPNQFRFHNDTPQFLRFIGDFQEGDRIVITEKLHGTSAVFSNVLTKRRLTLLEKLAKRLGISVKETEYYPLYSSRTVIKNSDINENQNGGYGLTSRSNLGYYGEDLWGIYAKLLEGKIEKGITLYGEIVGYTPSGAYIQNGYSYGCINSFDGEKMRGESKFYCYRITYTTPDGNVIEFTDSQIRQYCKIRSIDVVPLLHTLNYNDIGCQLTLSMHQSQIEHMCPMNENKVPREGVVIRRDGQETYSAYKLKSQLFLTWETKCIDDGVADTEENS